MSKRSNTSDAMLKFLMERVDPSQGISLEKLTGHLSQLPPELRTKYGCSIKDLKVFLQRYPNVFVVTDDSTVCLRSKGQSFDTSTSDSAIGGKDIDCLTDVTGTVYRLFPLYGFITIQSPVRTSVYFDVQSFENADHTSLPSSGLQVGDRVVFDAKLGPKDCKAKFRASRVTRASTTNLSSSPALSPRSANDEEVGDCGTFSHLVDQHGVVEFVKSTYGFIKFGPNEGERAFFHANKVDRSLGSWIRNLADVFSVEDKVRFNAKLSTKPSEKVKWEATAVCLCRSTRRGSASDTEDIDGNEVFMSDDECHFQDLLRAKLEEYQRREAGLNGSAVGYGHSDEKPANGDTSNSPTKAKRNTKPLLSEWERRQRLTGERGFLNPMTESLGTIKFGPDRGLTAAAAVEVTYRDEEPIDNLLWDVADGQEVSFDAVLAEDNTWIATLVWIGNRPAKPLVSDSEDVFTRITNKSMNARKPLPKAGTETCGNFGVEEIRGNLGESLLTQSSITIYKDVKGVVIQVTEGIGTCEVQELGVSRKVNFTSQCFYKDGTMFLGSLSDVLREGDMVLLDYMVGVSGRREEVLCHLVWLGRRPSEVRQMSLDAFRQRLHIDTQDGEYLACLKDLKAGMEQVDEACFGPSHVPSGSTGVPDGTVLSRGSGSSLSVSVAGLPTAPPAGMSTPTYVGCPGAHIETSTCEGAPDDAFLFAGLYDEGLDRLTKKTVANTIAEKETPEVDLRDVGVQTIDEEFSCSRPDAPDPALVCSSTQTISTGDIISNGFFIN